VKEQHLEEIRVLIWTLVLQKIVHIYI